MIYNYNMLESLLLLLLLASVCQSMHFCKLYVIDPSNPDTECKFRKAKMGKIMYSGHREGVKNLLTESLELAVNSWKTRSLLEPKLGKGNYVLAEYEKIKRITMPLGENHLLHMTAEVAADDSKIINGVRELNLQ